MSAENNPSTTSAFLDTLRQTTDPAHKRLEALPISMSLVSPDITLDIYRLYLELMSRVIYDVEHSLFTEMAELIPDIDARRKSLMIADDLQLLDSRNVHDELPLQAAGFKYTPAFAMGIMYVIEGSTLGGRVIVKNIKKTLALDEVRGAKYFSGYGDGTGHMWRAFLERLTTFEAETKSGEEIIAGAEFAFNVIYQYFKDKTAA